MVFSWLKTENTDRQALTILRLDSFVCLLQWKFCHFFICLLICYVSPQFSQLTSSLVRLFTMDKAVLFYKYTHTNSCIAIYSIQCWFSYFVRRINFFVGTDNELSECNSGLHSLLDPPLPPSLSIHSSQHSLYQVFIKWEKNTSKWSNALAFLLLLWANSFNCFAQAFNNIYIQNNNERTSQRAKHTRLL